VLGDQSLAVRPNSAVEDDEPVACLHGEVVDVERVVSGEMLAHQAAKLVVAQVVDVVQVFEIARHGSRPCCVGGHPGFGFSR
jgi:hypothetical protein